MKLIVLLARMLMNNIPSSKESERALLSAILNKPDTYYQICDIVSKETFYESNYREIFSAISTLSVGGDAIDAVSVASKLKENPASILKVPDILEIQNDYVSSNVARTHAEKIQDMYIRRQMLHIADDIKDFSYKPDSDLTHSIGETVNKITESMEVKKIGVNINDALDAFWQNIKDFKESGQDFRGTATGYMRLDRILDGVQKGMFGVITGYTSAGKTALALNIAASFIKQGKRVVMFSLEMSPEQLVGRLLGILSGVEIYDINHGRLSIEDKRKVTEAEDLLRKSNFSIYTESGWGNIQLNIIKESFGSKTDLFILDYLGLVTNGNTKERDSLKEISSKLQNQMKTLNIPMIALSQISNEQAKNDNPSIMSTKGSGDIAASADWVLRLRNSESDFEMISKYKLNKIPLPIDILVQKNRHGETTSAKYYFRTATGRFHTEKEYHDAEFERESFPFKKLESEKVEERYDF